MTTVEKAIEDIGFGPGQVLTQVLAHGIWMADGMEIGLVTSLTASIAKDMHLSHTEMASATSLVFVGIAAGCGFSAQIGDNFGRRPAVLGSYTGNAIFTMACACTERFETLVACRFLQGICIGLGMPASLALVSELSPAAWRIPLMAIRGVMFSVGLAMAALILALDDPQLQALNWRSDMILGALPCVLLGIPALGALHESPVFLAKVQRPTEAKEVIDWLSWMNSSWFTGHRARNVPDNPTACLEPLVPSGSVTTARTSVRESFSVTIFKGHVLLCTLVLCFAYITLNFVEYGLAYGEPRILREAVSNNPMPGAWQLFTKHMGSVPVRIVVVLPAVWLGPKGSMVLGFSFMSIGLLLFVWAASKSQWTAGTASAYYFGQALPGVGLIQAWIGAFQLPLDIYPAELAVTGSGLCIACGRVGSISAPYIFEIVYGRGWQTYWNFMAASSAMAAVTCYVVLPASSAGETTEETKDRLHNI